MFANENDLKIIKDNYGDDVVNLARDIAECFNGKPPCIYTFTRNSIQLESENKNAFIQVIINKNKEVELTCLSKRNDTNSMRLNSFVINDSVYGIEYLCRRIKDITKE